MGRHRHNPEGLPKRVYFKHGAYHYVDSGGSWHRLGARWDREAKGQYANKSSSVSAAGTVAHLLTSYLGHLHNRLLGGQLSHRHYADRQIDAAKLSLFFGRMQAVAVKRKHIALYLQLRTDKNGKPAPVRANREIAMLSAAFNWDANLEHNPCLNVPRNKEVPRDRYIEGWELRRFAKRCCPPWLRAYILLKHLTGLRMGDMLRLDNSAEGERGLRVRLGKSGGRTVLEFRWTRALRIASRFANQLSISVGDSQLRVGGRRRYFQNTHSGFKSAWRRAMKKWKDMGNTPFREHDIRAKTASDSSTLQTASERLGHDRTSTTSRHYRRGVSRTTPLR